jgi:hypothetical protein
MDNVVVKTKQSGTLLDDLKETFANLRRYRMKLNPKKCTFGVPAGQLLGYIISQRGIEANPSKIKAIEALEPPTELRDVQKFAHRAMPLYQLMKKMDHFVWSQRADEAFDDLKQALSTTPILAAPASREPNATLHRNHSASRQRGDHGRTHRGRQGAAGPAPGVLPE